MAKSSRSVTIVRSGNMIVVEPSTRAVMGLLLPQLTYTETIFLRGREKFAAIKAKTSTTVTQDWECFSFDHKDRISTSFGFYERIVKILEEARYRVALEDLTPAPRAGVYAPKLERVFGDTEVRWRYKQKAVLRLIASRECGRIDCPTGYGKSFLIGQACRMFPRAKIDIISTGVEVVCQRIYPELVMMGLDVGVVGGGKKILDRRVMCMTVGSAHYGRSDADFVFFDECHEAATDQAAGKLARYARARFWGFSASHDMRMDNKDMRCEAMFGPVRISVSYQKAVDKGMIVPIEVFWANVDMDVDPCGDDVDVDKLRSGIWANDYRNGKIQRDARRYDDQTQVLGAVATLEHALHLKKLLPEYELVYNGDNLEPDDVRYFDREGLLPHKFRPLSSKRKARLSRWFARGELKKVIVTTVWNRGVDMKHLQVLLRCDAGSSEVNSVQLPGRTSRIDGVKSVGVLHDYFDQFNAGFQRKATKRWGSYARLGFSQHTPGPEARSKLAAIMGWETK